MDDTSHLLERCRQAEAEVASLRAQVRAKGEVLSRMSHELRTPLNAVLGFSDLLRDQVAGPLNDEQRGYVRDIRTSGQHLLQVINDVLDLAKLDAGAMRLAREAVELELPVRQAEQMLQPLAAKKGLTLETELVGSAWCWGDLQRLRQVAVNLFGNAIKFTPSGGQIRARIETWGREVLFEVSDTGVGIAAADLERIFEEFYQCGPEGKEGTGLGLALSRGFVRQMGGELTARSELGKGSTFTVKLTSAAPSRKPAAVARLALARAASARSSP